MPSAEYMRAYRAKKRGDRTMSQSTADEINRTFLSQVVRIQDLEAEIVHLKRELAARPPYRDASSLVYGDGSWGSSRPAPKSGKR